MARRGVGNPLDFGGRVPAVVGALLVATAVVSLGGALALPLRRLLLLSPGAVWGGEVWRLVTYVVVENHPVSLLFGGLALWWLGPDLVATWGARGFLARYAGLPIAAAVVATLLAPLWPALAAHGFTGFWVALDAMVVAWGLLHPHRQILLFLTVPVSGRTLAAITVGGTVLFAIFDGPSAFVPHLAAEGLAWLQASGAGPGGWLRRIRLPRRRPRHRFEVIHADRDPDRRWLNRLVEGPAARP